MNSKLELDNSNLKSSASSIFQGYNNVTDQALNTALVGETNTSSGNSELQYTVTKSLEEIYSALNISASLSAKFFRSVSISAKVNFVKELKLTQESICIVVKASDKQNIMNTNNVKFKNDIKAPETEEEAGEFVKKYGDAYISELVTGAEYYAVYAFICETSKQRTDLEAQFQASGVSLFGGKLSASFQMKLENMSQSSSVNVTFQQIVSGFTNPHLPSQDQIIDYAISFFDRTIDQPAIISYNSTSYDHVPGFPAKVFDQINTNVKYFTDPNRQFTKNELEISGLISQCQEIESIYGHYKYKGDEKLIAVRQQAEKDLLKLEDQLNSYSSNPTGTYSIPELPSLASGKPTLQSSFKYSDLYGHGKNSEYGISFNDVNESSYFQNRTRLIAVKLGFEIVINNIETTYEYYDPRYQKHTYGNGRGDALQSTFDLNLDSNSTIDSISGRSGNYIDKLELISTTGNKITAGGGGGTSFRCDIPTDYFVAGFRGVITKSPEYRECLMTFGAIFAKLLPATWTK